MDTIAELKKHIHASEQARRDAQAAMLRAEGSLLILNVLLKQAKEEQSKNNFVGFAPDYEEVIHDSGANNDPE